MRYPNIEEISQLLETEWSDDFTFDRERASQDGVIVLLFKATERPVPLHFEISEKFFEKELMTRREFFMQIKDVLPSTLLKKMVSEINRLLRDGNRRAIKQVEKDLQKWIIKSADLITDMFGVEAGKKFAKELPLPAGIKSGTMRALQHVVESKIDLLKDL